MDSKELPSFVSYKHQGLNCVVKLSCSKPSDLPTLIRFFIFTIVTGPKRIQNHSLLLQTRAEMERENGGASTFIFVFNTLKNWFLTCCQSTLQ